MVRIIQCKIVKERAHLLFNENCINEYVNSANTNLKQSAMKKIKFYLKASLLGFNNY